MSITLRPHDLIWLNGRDALEGITEGWVDVHWHVDLPVVVRRDFDKQGRIPVGVRGLNRSQRAPAWVNLDNIVRICSPESLTSSQTLLKSPFVSLSPIQMALSISRHVWPWVWGITGSTGYALATGIPVMHSSSDLDLLIRAPQPLPYKLLEYWQCLLTQGSCQADTQIETLNGAFALNEWLRDGKALLKTSQGPRLVDNPWY